MENYDRNAGHLSDPDGARTRFPHRGRSSDILIDRPGDINRGPADMWNGRRDPTVSISSSARPGMGDAVGPSGRFGSDGGGQNAARGGASSMVAIGPGNDGRDGSGRAEAGRESEK
jgi:hypothetical protein